MDAASGMEPMKEKSMMTAPERAYAIEMLERSSREYLAHIDNLSEAQWTWKPGPDRWSVAETAEHAILAEQLLFLAVLKSVEMPANPAWELQTAGKVEFLERALLDRGRKVQSPEPGIPHGMAKEEAIRRFKAVRGQTTRFAEETQLALKQYTLDHPAPEYGSLNTYQWLLYIPLHNLRHNQQIAEVKSTPGFPKG